MIPVIFYYLILPFFSAWLVLKILKKYSPAQVDADIARCYESRPLQPKFFRTVRRDHKGVSWLGDFETQGEAVECAYKGKEFAQSTGQKAAFIVLNAKAEILEEVDS